MPLLNSLATPYAEALLQVTEARNESQTVADQCKQLLEIWNDSEDFRAAMVSPVFEPDAKKKVLQALVGEQVTPSVLNLLKARADRQPLHAVAAVGEAELRTMQRQTVEALLAALVVGKADEKRMTRPGGLARRLAWA